MRLRKRKIGSVSKTSKTNKGGRRERFMPCACERFMPCACDRCETERDERADSAWRAGLKDEADLRGDSGAFLGVWGGK